ncbi:DnaJ (Hsp40) homolog, subfamily C, member 13 [Seminavis robusta]|uniref:DnaJ (Hsp40) homolog, subfamily C, member 13 n=1 Tax=Seminavis robusta TaxID=568900 RepID=A0A9N8DT98_9STRA|nr:DnaJ (Hsp40) homolog, subfamily C, member 13 [Seminavis robusta]|eukprot:Sro235_g094680.1 DnaJ (Hsp40) homolog, subfamily C, member 13 (3287) ;mRNA; r:23961-34226
MVHQQPQMMMQPGQIPQPMQQQQQPMVQQQLQQQHSGQPPAQGTLPPQPPPANTNDTTAVPTKASVATPPEKANLGFAPTKALSKKHEVFLQNATENNSPARPLYSFQVTKLRSWRTGYVRLLRLYADHFCTLDPETHQVTNTWPYTALADWLAIPKEDDTILLQVAKDKLKFKCHTNRSTVLTALLECKNESAATLAQQQQQQQDQNNNNNNNWIVIPFPQCQRQTRKMTRVPVSLHATPFGLVELSPATRKVIQTYRYTDIAAASFTTDDPRGIVLYHAKNTDTQGHVRVGRLYFIHSARQGGNGRSDLLTILQDHYTILGLDPIDMRPSTTVQKWMEARRDMASHVGPIATTWAVSKTTRRHHVQCVGPMDGWVGGIVSRQLVITGRGYLMEKDGAGVVNCRPLSHLHSIVRVPHRDLLLTGQQQQRDDNKNDITQNKSGGDQLVLEFTHGSTCTYTCSNRDALLVSLLDATMTLGKKATVQLSDVRCAGYCLSSLEDDTEVEPAPSSAASSLFQPISIPVHCLNRVYAVSIAAYAFVTHAGETVDPASVPINVVQQCQVVVEACREFNASVLPTGEGLPLGEKDKTIAGTIGALWGLVYELLRVPPNMSQLQSQLHVRDRQAAEQIACTLLQSLYRLSQTTTGYKVTVELTTMQDCIPLIWQIKDDFGKFWAFRTLSMLVSGKRGKMPQLRDMELEFVNKKVILTRGGPTLVNGLVNALLESGQYVNNTNGSREQRVNDLILMVISDILQSILCSYHDTTTPEHFQAFIVALSKGYKALLSALRSSTPFVVENVALLLHLLSTHAPGTSAKIRDAALSSATLLHHFHAAIFSPMEGQRFLSRYLCSLWLSGPMDCDEKRLLKRMVPGGFLNFMSMPPLSRMEEEQLDALERDNAIEGNISDRYMTTVSLDDDGDPTVATASEAASQTGAAGTNTARLRSRIALASATAKNKPIAGGQQQRSPRDNSKPSHPENFRIFFHVLTKDHNLADLIWNQQTRRELRIALESERQYIYREAEARGIENIAWNHQQFSVEYPSLINEVKVGGTRGVYMRLWLQAGDAFIKTWDEPLRLFEQLFRRFLCESDRNPKVTVMCVRCLERLYAIHARTIGPFSDAMILVRSMASTRSIETQHRLLGLVATILGVSRNDDGDDDEGIHIPENAEQLLNAESIEQLCQFVAWGHTNGVQVGNLLTTVLSSNQKLLTDGTNSGPGGAENEGTGEKQSANAAPDSSCPPVWFTARTGRIPPPEESIRGPFRVSELATMMSNGDLSPFDLVTAIHSESYDDEDDAGSGGVKEAQIDTGKWKRVEQVWQLRWQLCTDGSGGGIYSPSDVALLAIRSLTRLVDLHRSLDSSGVPYYPIPIAKRVLCGLSRDPTRSSDPSQSQASLQRDSFLSIIAQALLCNDFRVVGQASEVLHKLMMHNEEAIAKFYLTGIYFFIGCYTGSNFKPLAKLLHATHLKQHFRSGFAAAANESELPMKDRSVLGNMLPEGLLFILVNYGFERFSEIFVSSYDTPEVIWDFDMRKHLIEMIRQHLGDFPKRLWQNTTARYEFCPIPGVSYKRLEKEIFCHNYYLANLCDEVRFPDWPISEPVEVFRACLEELKKQLTRDETEEEVALESARKVLDLKQGDGSKELRKAYRSLARKFHPDKNPAGRETFEAIQAAYELLLPIVESGQKIRVFSDDGGDDGDGEQEENVFEGFGGGRSQMQAIHLLIKTQLLICKRYEKEMSKYKYPAYRMVLSCLEIPPSSKEALQKEDPSALLFAVLSSVKRAEFMKTTVALVFQTCLVSPLNSQELIVEGGVAILDSLLNYYIRVAQATRKGGSTEFDAEDCIIEILSHIVHTIAGVAFFESGRAAILALENPTRLCINWRRCIDMRYLSVSKRENIGDSAIKRYALEGVANMARDEKLQELLIGCGIVWPLIKYMLGYDPTLELVANVHDDQDDIGVSQAASNTQARLSTRAMGMLCGVLQDKALVSPRNDALTSACSKLLTSPVALMLRNKRTGELLKTLNSNVETAARIWNVSMRNELNSFLQETEKKRPEAECQSIEDELSRVKDFEYSLLKEELRIGGVYIRVFNRMGSGREAIREVPNPSMFAKHVTAFIARSINASDDLPDGWVELRVLDEVDENEASPFVKEESSQTVSVRGTKFLMAIKALLQLVRVDGLIDDVLCAPSSAVPSVLLSLLELPQDSETFDIGCDILSIMSPKQPFADSVSRQGALWRLLSVLERPDPIEMQETAESSGDEDRAIIRRKVKGWALMESLSSSPSVATKMIESSCWLELLGILVGYAKFSRMWAARVGAAKTLSRLMWDPQTGPSTAPLLQRFLPSTLVVRLKEEGPDAMLKLFDGESDTPELIWDSSMRAELRGALSEQLDECLVLRKESGEDRFTLPSGVFVKYKKLEDELFIGGVYLSRFLKEPTYNLRDPTTFLEMVMQRWTHELQTFFSTELSSEEKKSSSTALVDASQDTLQLVTSACVYLCKVRDSLCDKLAQWGYMERCLTFIDEILDRQLFGSPLLSVMRVLHVASNRIANVEAICVSGRSDGKNSVVDYTMKSISSDTDSLHPDAAFMVEMLKKVFTVALGDVKNAPKPMKGLASPMTGSMYAMAPSPAPGDDHVSNILHQKSGEEYIRFMALAMAPSPAPGEGYVQRGRVAVGDDPLAMFGGAPTAPQQPMGGSGGQGHMPQQGFSGGYASQPAPMNTGQTLPQSFSNQSQTPQMPMGGSSFMQQSSMAPPFSHAQQHGNQSFRGQGMQGMPSRGFQQGGGGGNPSLGASYSNMGNSSSMSSSGFMQGVDAYGRPQTPQSAGSSSVQSSKQPGMFHKALLGLAGGQPARPSNPQQQQPQQSSFQGQQQQQQYQSQQTNSMQQPQQFNPRQQPQQTQHRQQQGMRQPMGQQANQGMMQSQMSYQQGEQHASAQGQPQRIMQSKMSYQQGQGLMQHQGQPQLRQQSMMQGQQPQPQQQQQPQHHHHATQQSQQQQQTQAMMQRSQMQQPRMQQPHGMMNQGGQMQQQAQQGVNQPRQSMQQQAHQQQQGLMQQQPVQPQRQGMTQQQPMQSQQGMMQPQVQGMMQQHPPAMMQQQQGMMQQAFTQLQHEQVNGNQVQQASQFQVETVADDNELVDPSQQMMMPQPEPQEAPQYRPTAVAGSGIDARTKPDPKVEAEQLAVSSGGAPGAANGRVALLQSALVNELPKFLLEGVLENPSLKGVKDPAATKVHTVDLLKLLTEDPGYGMKFRLILDEMPAWTNYKSQDHSLFITGSEQKTDYFLTDGSSGEPTKMLTQG